jgi:hypothetical protein
MSMGFRADPTGTSGVITVAGADQVVVTNASNVVATTFTGALAGNASTATKLSTATGAAPVYGVRAWVNFDLTRDSSGASNLANTNRFVYGSGNVANVLRVGTANFTVFFTTAMPNANYSISAFASNPLSGFPFTAIPVLGYIFGYSQTVNNTGQISCVQSNSATYSESPFVSVMIVG